MLRALKGESTDNVEAIIRNAAHPDGVHVSVNGRPLFGASGKIVGGVVVAHDVSSRKRDERELMRQRALLQSVLDCVVETVSVYDADGRMVLSNPAFDRMTGTKFGANASVEERFRSYGLFTADGKRRLTLDEVPAHRAMRGEPIQDLELVIRNPAFPDGIVMSTNAQRLVDAKGIVIGAVVTGRDVTSRKQAEEKLLDQKKLLTSILECLAEGVAVYDLEGRILLLNPAAERVLDRTIARDDTLEERSKQYGTFSVDGKRTLPLGETAFGRALRGEVCDDVELLMRSPGRAHDIHISSNGRLLRDDRGAPQGVVVTIRDIGPRVAVEKQKAQLLAELHRSNDELARFAYAASHDLRAPLRAIENLARWLEEDLKPHFTAETTEQMRLLRSRVGRLERLLSDLLEFSRVGTTRTEVTRVDVGRLIAEVIELAAPPSAFRVETKVSVGSLETASLPLKRALLNLVTNAIKHHDRTEGTVQIEARENGELVEFLVTDDGPGIPAQFHAKIFEMFQTLRPRDSVEGSGMGLAFVRKIVDQAAGTLTVESHGRGSAFRMGWPKVWSLRRS